MNNRANVVVVSLEEEDTQDIVQMASHLRANSSTLHPQSGTQGRIKQKCPWVISMFWSKRHVQNKRIDTDRATQETDMRFPRSDESISSHPLDIREHWFWFWSELPQSAWRLTDNTIQSLCTSKTTFTKRPSSYALRVQTPSGPPGQFLIQLYISTSGGPLAGAKRTELINSVLLVMLCVPFRHLNLLSIPSWQVHSLWSAR